jgi:hypothetical protein
MTTQLTKSKTHPLRLLQSVAAVLFGMIAIVVLSLGTDQVLHVLEVYPPWSQPMNDTSDNLLALTYRCVYGVLGSYLTARLAPYSPLGHSLAGGAIGFVLSTAGAIAAINMNLGPSWYPSRSHSPPCPVPGLAACSTGRREPREHEVPVTGCRM